MVSKKLHLQDGALSIYETCKKTGVKWIPRSSADFLSRIIDYDDWKVDPSLFVILLGAHIQLHRSITTKPHVVSVDSGIQVQKQ